MKIFTRYCFQSILIVLIASILSHIVIIDLSSMDFLDSSESSGNKYRITDAYNSIAHKVYSKYLDRNIIIIDIDNCSRKEISNVIKAINGCSPKVIGLDVFFKYPSDDGLLESINNCENIVLPIEVTFIPEENTFTLNNGSFFYNQINNINLGVTNLTGNSVFSIIREFCPSFNIAGEKLDGFAASIVRIADYKKYKILSNRQNIVEDIFFPNNSFMVYHYSELMDDNGVLYPELKNIIKDHIILIGSLNDEMDLHLTPIDNAMPGIMIHAITISTILNNSYISHTSLLLNWIIAIIFCFFFTFLSLVSKNGKWNNITGIGIRIIQFSIIYFFIILGCYIYYSYHTSIDFTITITMLGLSIIAIDIFYGINDLFKLIISFIWKK